MSVSLESIVASHAKKRFRAKPYSVERRFQLMQSATVLLALLLALLALYWNLSSQERLQSSLQTVNTTLAFSREVQSRHEAVVQSFWEAYEFGSAESRADYDRRAAEAAALLSGYSTSSLSPAEAFDVDQLRDLERKLFARTAAILSAGRSSRGGPAGREEIGRLGEQVDAVVEDLESLQIARLESHGERMLRISSWVTVALLLSAGLAPFAIAWFRREQRRHLWSHLESLRRMVSEIRRGNLRVTADIPESVELGSLMSAFVQMAAELRDMRDSLERKVVERTASLELAHKDLLQSAKLSSLGQLVSGVAHEINNPLTSILGFSEVALFRSAPGSSLNTQLRTIRSEALRLRHLVSNLTTFARRAPRRTERFDLRGLLARLSDLHGYQLRVNNISLHESSVAEPVWVLADPEQLTQVILNLVLNAEHAIKNSRERGDIWLTCGTAGDFGFFSLRDNGSGMAPEVRDHMFDPFFTTKPTGQGTGLGLSISYGIVQQHQGTIAVESTLGEGATFRVQLPLAHEVVAEIPAPRATSETPAGSEPLADRPADPVPAPPPAPVPNEPDAATESAFYALVIDDEESILEMVSEALESIHGRTMLLNGSSGVAAALAANRFDLVISDLKMPGQNGAEVFLFIRENYPGLAARFLLMTGNLADAEKYTAELAGIPILPKPFTIARLRQAVTDLLEKAPPG